MGRLAGADQRNAMPMGVQLKGVSVEGQRRAVGGKASKSVFLERMGGSKSLAFLAPGGWAYGTMLRD